MYACPKDPTHQSVDSDYCSVCGAKIPGGAGALSAATVAPSGLSPSAAAAVAGGAQLCPDCGALRVGGARFCEVCRYNFDSQSPGTIVAMPPTPPPIDMPPPIAPIDAPPSTLSAAAPVNAPSAPSSATPVDSMTPADVVTAPVPTPLDTSPSPTSTTGLQRWELAVTVDPTLYIEPDSQIPRPTNEPDRVFPLDFAENLIGRRSDQKDIHPEVPINDPCISRRHAKLLRQPDGAFALLDVGSTNGTRLNDVDVQPGVRMPLQDGDQITLGCWTRITVRAL